MSLTRPAALLRRTVSPCLRQYHSANHPPSPSYTPLQHQVLSTALTLVPSKGFTPETLAEAAKQSGYLEITHNLFPRGPFSIVEYHLIKQREALASVPLEEGLGIGRTIRRLCVERLKGNAEIIERWQEVCFVHLRTGLMLGTCIDGITGECTSFIEGIGKVVG
jgi:ubiquinone biosynthesis protein COQ9